MVAGVSCRTSENFLSWRDIVPLPLLLHYSDESAASIEKGEKVRFIVLEDVKGQTVTIFIESSAVGFEEFLAKGQKVVDSVKWGGS